MINYRDEDVAAVVLAIADEGVDTIVDVNVQANGVTDLPVLKFGGTIAICASDSSAPPTAPIASATRRNSRFQFVLTYTVTEETRRPTPSRTRLPPKPTVRCLWAAEHGEALPGRHRRSSPRCRGGHRGQGTHRRHRRVSESSRVDARWMAATSRTHPGSPPGYAVNPLANGLGVMRSQRR